MSEDISWSNIVIELEDIYQSLSNDKVELESKVDYVTKSSNLRRACSVHKCLHYRLV